MKIGELARRSGLSAHTIRYYERIGLLPYADRNRSSHRDYDASILTWIAFLGRLKTTGMPIRDMLRYAALRNGGVATQAERRAMLERHRAQVLARAADLQACLLVLDAKIAGYAGTALIAGHAGRDERIQEHDTPHPPRRRQPAGARPARAR